MEYIELTRELEAVGRDAGLSADVLRLYPFTDTCGGAFAEIDSRAISEQPAVCEWCGRRDWWIHRDQPLCLRCGRPTIDQRCEIWEKAHGWLQSRGVDMAHGWLDFLLVHGSQWQVVQQMAFASRASELIERRFDQEHA